MSENLPNQPIDEIVNVELSKDKMLGVIWFSSPQNGGKPLRNVEIKDSLIAHGISSGINEELLDELYIKRKYDYKYIVAQGKAPIDGEDGKIIFNFDVKELQEFKPVLNDDGTVDLKNINIVKNVKKGDLLATSVHATPGEEGYNVLGQVLKAKKGKEARIPKGRNTILLEDGVSLVANVDGKLEYDDHNIYINEVFTIHGDVDSSTGNIDFIGSVVVNGSVHSGFSIKAGGSIEIRGPVDEATLVAKGDVVLGYGIQGGNVGKIVCDGNVIAKFIQNTTIEAGGDVITEAILHSTVSAGKSIKVEMGKGIIVGGNISATDIIIARNIGSPMGTTTAIQIGVPPSMYQEYHSLTDEMKKVKENLCKVDQGIKFLLAKMKNGRLEPDKQLMLQKFNASRQPLVEEYEEIRVKYEKLGNLLSDTKEGMIKVTGEVFPGVKVEFGNLIKYIDDTYTRCVIRKQDGEIYIGV